MTRVTCQTESTCEFDADPINCVDCLKDGKVTRVPRDHHLQGFGHQFRCCACYERRQRGPA